MKRIKIRTLLTLSLLRKFEKRFVKLLKKKTITLESTAAEFSIEWSYCRISSTDIKVRTTFTA